ncbi:MAG: (d)CMP kinase [Proteobacteria bacterium]|nr:(d)CMP kinase [Pseudomonadota bacterium]
MSVQVMPETDVPVVTIDGPAGSGKGTIAVKLAQQLGYHYLGSGSLYRILAHYRLQHLSGTDDLQELLRHCETLRIVFQPQGDEGDVQVLVNEADVSDELRTEECGGEASRLAVRPEVREALLKKQLSFRKAPGLVAEGRDMGTVVFPDAPHKIYLTASAEERAHRRQKQLRKQGISASLDRLLAEIKTRDTLDKQRPISPLRPAADAVRVDSTDLSILQVVERIAALVQQG